MPVYEYTCKSCKARFEHMAKSMSTSEDADKIPCPECGSKQTARELSVFAVGSSAPSASGAEPMCGRCGGAPGSCQFNN